MHRRRFSALIGLGVTGWIASSATSNDALWSGWRGNRRDGIVTDPSLPKSLDEATLKLLWTIPLDASYSGPIVDEQSVYVTETRKAKSETIVALDRKTGSKRWEREWEGAMAVPFFAKANGDWIRSTPSMDDDCIYIAGMRDVLVCVQKSDGKERWRVDFTKQFGTPLPDFGFVCSPLIDDDALLVQAGGGLVKLNKNSGSVLWRSLVDGGGMNGSAFSSPIKAQIHGQDQYLVQTRTQLCGVDTATGKPLWTKEVEAFRGMNILTPTVWKNQVFTSSYGGKSWLFALKPKENEPWTVETVWEHKAQGYMSSPVVVQDHAYLHLRNQRCICLDLANGKETWTSRPFGKYWSMVASDQRILALDETGNLRLIEANPTEFRVLSERKVSEEECWAHIALSQNQLFVRHLKGLSVFEW